MSSRGRIIFAIDGEIPEGPFSIRGYADGMVAYDTPIGNFRRLVRQDGSLGPPAPASRRGRKRKNRDA